MRQDDALEIAVAFCDMRSMLPKSTEMMQLNILGEVFRCLSATEQVQPALRTHCCLSGLPRVNEDVSVPEKNRFEFDARRWTVLYLTVTICKCPAWQGLSVTQQYAVQDPARLVRVSGPTYEYFALWQCWLPSPPRLLTVSSR